MNRQRQAVLQAGLRGFVQHPAGLAAGAGTRLGPAEGLRRTVKPGDDGIVGKMVLPNIVPVPGDRPGRAPAAVVAPHLGMGRIADAEAVQPWASTSRWNDASSDAMPSCRSRCSPVRNRSRKATLHGPGGILSTCGWINSRSRPALAIAVSAIGSRERLFDAASGQILQPFREARGFVDGRITKA